MKVIVPMAEVVKEDPKDPKKKSVFAKIKEKAGDSEEHLAILSNFVRLGVLIWSGGILTLNYVTIPGLAQQKIDPTFIASVFTGVLASYGVQTAKKSGDGTMKMNGGSGITKADIEKLIEKAAQTAPAQVIRVEQAPLKITTTTEKDDTYKM
jgi:hypothetical protein|tara:strand:- start:1102 stop:1557 length:456 start_codon:yes stop_codon:yes gene_type:complete